MIIREDIMEALFQRLRTSAPFVGAFRNWMDINQCPEGERPVLFMLEGDEDALRARAAGPPGITQFRIEAMIYGWSGGLAKPASVINALVDAVVNSLDPVPDGITGRNTQTLGGLVYDAWVSGRIVKVPGYVDGHALAVIPIMVRVPNV